MIAHLRFPLASFLLGFIVNAQHLGADTVIRVMTFNLEDVRHSEALEPGNRRLERLAEVIQRVRPNVLLINEIETIDLDGKISTVELFLRNYLSVPQAEDLSAIDLVSFTPSTNTGVHSGIDLDRSGSVDPTIPAKTIRQSQEQRDYGGDCFGFGGFPGQYGMALLVDPKLNIKTDSVRTFQHLLWKDLPGAIAPTNQDGSAYYSDQAWDIFRLSSKTFADIPITLPNGAVLHALISHPTPPAFDGPEMRNKHRNRDEIKLIRTYIDGESSLYDDAGVRGGLAPNASFVILGDLNADPVDGSSLGNPIQSFLLSSERVARDVEPRSCIGIERLDELDTSSFRLRVDYVLPSSDCEILDAGVWRHGVYTDDGFASDHFPVWVDLVVPTPE
jgi:Endonuclease/Exonuclease/phosphatase family